MTQQFRQPARLPGRFRCRPDSQPRLTTGIDLSVIWFVIIVFATLMYM
ncbi:MAG: hypothetical protein ACLR17_13150 [Enterobacteriaceae bacterium]